MDLSRTVLSVVLALSATGFATAETARLQQIAQTLEQNRKLLSAYTWKARTETLVEEKVQEVHLYQVTLDDRGRLRQKELEVADPGKRKKQPKKLVRFSEELHETVRSYTELSDRQVQIAFARAHAWDGRGDREGTVHIQSRSVVLEGDTVDLWVDSASLLPVRLEILTSLQGEPVRVRARYEELERGPAYAASTEVESEFKEKKLVLRTERFDFERVAGKSG